MAVVYHLTVSDPADYGERKGASEHRHVYEDEGQAKAAKTKAEAAGFNAKIEPVQTVGLAPANASLVLAGTPGDHQLDGNGHLYTLYPTEPGPQTSFCGKAQKDTDLDWQDLSIPEWGEDIREHAGGYGVPPCEACFAKAGFPKTSGCSDYCPVAGVANPLDKKKMMPGDTTEQGLDHSAVPGNQTSVGQSGEQGLDPATPGNSTGMGDGRKRQLRQAQNAGSGGGGGDGGGGAGGDGGASGGDGGMSAGGDAGAPSGDSGFSGPGGGLACCGHSGPSHLGSACSACGCRGSYPRPPSHKKKKRKKHADHVGDDDAPSCAEGDEKPAIAKFLDKPVCDEHLRYYLADAPSQLSKAQQGVETSGSTDRLRYENLVQKLKLDMDKGEKALAEIDLQKGLPQTTVGAIMYACERCGGEATHEAVTRTGARGLLCSDHSRSFKTASRAAGLAALVFPLFKETFNLTACSDCNHYTSNQTKEGTCLGTLFTRCDCKVGQHIDLTGQELCECGHPLTGVHGHAENGDCSADNCPCQVVRQKTSQNLGCPNCNGTGSTPDGHVCSACFGTGHGGGMMIHPGSVTASTGAECNFEEKEPGKWFYQLQQYPYGETEDYDHFGPFPSLNVAERHLSDNHANPGGHSVEGHPDSHAAGLHKTPREGAREGCFECREARQQELLASHPDHPGEDRFMVGYDCPSCRKERDIAQAEETLRRLKESSTGSVQAGESVSEDIMSEDTLREHLILSRSEGGHGETFVGPGRYLPMKHSYQHRVLNLTHDHKDAKEGSTVGILYGDDGDTYQTTDGGTTWEKVGGAVYDQDEPDRLCEHCNGPGCDFCAHTGLSMTPTLQEKLQDMHGLPLQDHTRPWNVLLDTPPHATTSAAEHNEEESEEDDDIKLFKFDHGPGEGKDMVHSEIHQQEHTGSTDLCPGCGQTESFVRTADTAEKEPDDDPTQHVHAPDDASELEGGDTGGIDTQSAGMWDELEARHPWAKVIQCPGCGQGHVTCTHPFHGEAPPAYELPSNSDDVWSQSEGKFKVDLEGGYVPERHEAPPEGMEDLQGRSKKEIKGLESRGLVYHQTIRDPDEPETSTHRHVHNTLADALAAHKKAESSGFVSTLTPTMQRPLDREQMFHDVTPASGGQVSVPEVRQKAPKKPRTSAVEGCTDNCPLALEWKTGSNADANLMDEYANQKSTDVRSDTGLAGPGLYADRLQRRRQTLHRDIMEDAFPQESVDPKPDNYSSEYPKMSSALTISELMTDPFEVEAAPKKKSPTKKKKEKSDAETKAEEFARKNNEIAGDIKDVLNKVNQTLSSNGSSEPNVEVDWEYDHEDADAGPLPPKRVHVPEEILAKGDDDGEVSNHLSDEHGWLVRDWKRLGSIPGLVNDGVTDNTAAIEAAINPASGPDGTSTSDLVDNVGSGEHPVPVKLITDHRGEVAQGVEPGKCRFCGQGMEWHAQWNPTHQTRVVSSSMLNSLEGTVPDYTDYLDAEELPSKEAAGEESIPNQPEQGPCASCGGNGACDNCKGSGCDDCSLDGDCPSCGGSGMEPYASVESAPFPQGGTGTARDLDPPGPIPPMPGELLVGGPPSAACPECGSKDWQWLHDQEPSLRDPDPAENTDVSCTNCGEIFPGPQEAVSRRPARGRPW